MKSVELNAKGNFDTWDSKSLIELEKGNFNTALGHYLLFENSHIKLWEVVLMPKERLTFREQRYPYVWVCETDGMAISRLINGQIFLSDFEKGDTAYFEPEENNYVRDFENIGGRLLKMTVIEFIKKTEPVSIPLGFL